MLVDGIATVNIALSIPPSIIICFLYPLSAKRPIGNCIKLPHNPDRKNALESHRTATTLSRPIT